MEWIASLLTPRQRSCITLCPSGQLSAPRTIRALRLVQKTPAHTSIVKMTAETSHSSKSSFTISTLLRRIRDNRIQLSSPRQMPLLGKVTQSQSTIGNRSHRKVSLYTISQLMTSQLTTRPVSSPCSSQQSRKNLVTIRCSPCHRQSQMTRKRSSYHSNKGRQ